MNVFPLFLGGRLIWFSYDSCYGFTLDIKVIFCFQTDSRDVLFCCCCCCLLCLISSPAGPSWPRHHTQFGPPIAFAATAGSPRLPVQVWLQWHRLVATQRNYIMSRRQADRRWRCWIIFSASIMKVITWEKPTLVKQGNNQLFVSYSVKCFPSVSHRWLWWAVFFLFISSFCSVWPHQLFLPPVSGWTWQNLQLSRLKRNQS